MNVVHFDVYYRRATQMASAMKLCLDDMPAYASAAAVLAVHSAISYNDALLISFGQNRPKSENHRDAIAALKRACKQRRIDDQRGIRHLQSLIDAKTDVAYGENRFPDEKIQALCVAAKRFQAWSEKTFQSMDARERRP